MDLVRRWEDGRGEKERFPAEWSSSVVSDIPLKYLLVNQREREEEKKKIVLFQLLEYQSWIKHVVGM